MSNPKTSFSQASEATVNAVLNYWCDVAKSSDPATRAVAYTELTAVHREVDARKRCGLWKTGAFPGPNTFKKP